MVWHNPGIRQYDHTKIFQYDMAIGDESILLYVDRKSGDVIKVSIEGAHLRPALLRDVMEKALPMVDRQWRRRMIRKHFKVADLHLVTPEGGAERSVWISAWFLVIRREFDKESARNAIRRLSEQLDLDTRVIERMLDYGIRNKLVNSVTGNTKRIDDGKPMGRHEKIYELSKAGREVYAVMHSRLMEEDHDRLLEPDDSA